MIRPKFPLPAVVTLAVVIVLLVVVYQEMSHIFTAAETWCQGHNGTLIANETLRCELPNGTVREIPENVTD